MTEYNTILYEKQRKGVLITLNRPETLNAISQEVAGELSRALYAADADPEVRAVVLTGAGRAFSSGYDIGAGRAMEWPSGLPEGANIAEQIEFQRNHDRGEQANLLQIWDMGTPVIAAVNGWCLAGASWYALACHMTFASEQAVFGQPEVRMGDDTNFFWVLNAGYKHALRYALTGDHLDAHEALRIGLINEVVPHDQLIDRCFSIVERIAMNAPETVKINLQVATKGLNMMGLRNALLLNDEMKALAHLSRSKDFYKPLDEAQRRGGLREFLKLRDGPFLPEPFGPRSKPRD